MTEAAAVSVSVSDDAEEGEIVDDDEEDDTDQAEAVTAPDNKHSSSSTSPHSSKSTATSDKQHKKPSSGKSGGRDSSTKKQSSSSSRKRRDKDSDGDGDKAAKKARESDLTSEDSAAESDDAADPAAAKQKLMMQMMQIMLNASKQGKKSDRKTIELMDKMIKRGSDVSLKEMREIIRKNKRLLRSGSRDRRSRSRSRDRRSRRRSASRDKDSDNRSKFGRNQSPDRTLVTGPGVDPRTGVGLLKEKCKFFAEGKCHKGFECPFSHEIVLTKKREICKFYLQGYCGKGEHCFFMHEEFPCKFFHTGADCYSGDKCRFSHQPLTEEGRSILRGYLDSGELPDDHLRNRQPETGDADVDSVPAAAPNQNNAATSAPPATTAYQPVKPVPKRHAILGDVTDAMRTSYYSWQWQQELKELEMAYTGNKRNLFCVDKQFIVAEKPETPPPEDPDEAEFKVFSFYTDTLGDVDIRQFTTQPPPPITSEVNDLMPEQNEVDQDDLFLMSAAHDEDLRVPPPNWSNPASDPVVAGAASDINSQLLNTEQTEPSSETENNTPVEQVDAGVRDTGGGDSPSNHSNQTESRTKPKYDIAKMLNVIRQSTNQSSSASPAVPGHSEFWQNIFSGTTFTVASSPNSSAQMSPSQVRSDPRLKKEQRQEENSALVKQNSVDQESSENADFRLVAMNVPRIDYSHYVSMYHNDCKLKNDPRLQKFFTRSSSLDQLTQLLPQDSSSKSFMSSAITQSTLASLMSSSGNHTTSSPVKFGQDQDDRLTPTSPPHQLPAPPPLALNQVPQSPVVSHPSPALTPLELMTSKPIQPLKTPSAPPQLSLHSYADQNNDYNNAHHETGNGNASAMDLSAKKVKSESEPEPEDDDTPASPSSRRSSCDTLLSPPLIQAAAADEPDPMPDLGLKSVFSSIDPAASPFC